MTFKEQVNSLLQAALEQREDLFLVSLTISEANKIQIIIDGDNGVSIQDCIDVSRAVEHNLDREEVDFELEVASYGALTAFSLPRQFAKNKGRNVAVLQTNGEKFEAVIAEVTTENVTFTWSVREPKPIGKGKHTVEKTLTLPYDEIKSATVIIVF
ncbi:ribosome assembly cofactor RimP [Flavobacterium agricola]|uniref:Ribosome maturation factor RimP n=1 Tax=Flavobacterium agricola TaxID=2870839 RepID=A0ABY6M0Q0_9FLAO|nr:ribosome assembly cofactor RimP [Flavobacterium agricola]UYW00778.1 ribosome assembly cofactor RimP [Flavobacterium agricola]